MRIRREDALLVSHMKQGASNCLQLTDSMMFWTIYAIFAVIFVSRDTEENNLETIWKIWNFKENNLEIYKTI